MKPTEIIQQYNAKLQETESAICFICGSEDCSMYTGASEETEHYWICNECDKKLMILFRLRYELQAAEIAEELLEEL